MQGIDSRYDPAHRKFWLACS